MKRYTIRQKSTIPDVVIKMLTDTAHRDFKVTSSSARSHGQKPAEKSDSDSDSDGSEGSNDDREFAAHEDIQRTVAVGRPHDATTPLAGPVPHRAEAFPDTTAALRGAENINESSVATEPTVYAEPSYWKEESSQYAQPNWIEIESASRHSMRRRSDSAKAQATFAIAKQDGRRENRGAVPASYVPGENRGASNTQKPSYESPAHKLPAESDRNIDLTLRTAKIYANLLPFALTKEDRALCLNVESDNVTFGRIGATKNS